MIIDLASVGVSPRAIEGRFAPGEIDLEEAGSLSSDAVFSGEILKIDDRVHLRGTVTANVEVRCTRCLEPLSQHLEIAFDDIYVDAANETRENETELELDELDEELVVGGQVDLREAVREQVILALPDTVLCREDCQGLCPKCGENRNLIDCKCESDEIDPRWAALKNLN